MTTYREYGDASAALFGYDPVMVLKADHLARLIDKVVEESVGPPVTQVSPGQPAYDPRLGLKVLVYAYATGTRSSRQIARLCVENLAYLFLTRGAKPSFRMLCGARTEHSKLLEQCWTDVLLVAAEMGIKRVGRIDLDSTKIRANASSESVLKACDLPYMREQLAAILDQAKAIDTREDAEGAEGDTRTGVDMRPLNMRDLLRRVRKAKRNGDAKPDIDARELGPRMRERLSAAVKAIDDAEPGQKHVCLTDPDARMMAEGRSKKIRECHSLEVAADGGVLVAAQSSQCQADSPRLSGLVAAASANEPDGVKLVVADSGYFSTDAVVAIEEQGTATCIPDPKTARRLRCKTREPEAAPEAAMTYEPEADRYRCSQGRLLTLVQQRADGGTQVKIYRAVQSCSDCPVRLLCMSHEDAKRRTLKIPVNAEKSQTILERFEDPQHQRIYHGRGAAVETVFAFFRTQMNVRSWSLRGKTKVEAEATLLWFAYQLRKIHSAQTKPRAAAAA